MNFAIRAFALAFLLLVENQIQLFAQDGKGGKAAPAVEPTVDELINDLRNGDLDKKTTALRNLERMGPKAKAAVPDLISALSNPESRVHQGAISALGEIGPDAKDALPSLRLLLNATKANDPYASYGLLRAIILISKTVDLDMTRSLALLRSIKSNTPFIFGYLNEYASQMAPHLIKLLDDLDVNVRTVAAQSFLEMCNANPGRTSILKKIGDKAKPIAPALAAHLNDPDPNVVQAVAMALTHVDPELGIKAIPVVLQSLKVKNIKQAHTYAAAAILAPVAKATMPLALTALDDKNAEAREPISAMLSQLDGSLEPLIAGLNDERAFVRAGVAKGIALKYSAGVAAAPALVAALGDPERVVRFAAADALVWTGAAQNKEAVPVLVEVIRDGSEAEKRSAAELLSRVGPPAKAAAPDLIALLKDERFPVRFEAAVALTTIDVASAAKGVAALIEGTQSANNYQQHQAAKSLAEIGPAAKAAIPALEKLFEAKYVHARYSAADAVARIDPSKMEAAVQVLVATLREKKNQNSMVRTYVLKSLRRIGPAASSAIPALEELLDDDGAFHGEVAITAVCLGGENAKAAAKFIREHLVRQPVDDDGYELIEFLHHVGPNAKIFVPEIGIVLEKSKTPYLQEQMCETIEAIGPLAKDLEPQLRALIAKSKRPQTVEAATKALLAIGAKK